ncbi:MAG: S8 family peptidase [Eubacteriales bacterium]
MPERPIILFPEAENANREKEPKFVPPPHIPTFPRQYDRLAPKLSILKNAFQQKNIAIQQSSVGINPEFALVFEIIGSVDNFYNAIKHIEGFEWMFDSSVDDINADDDFYTVDKQGQPDNSSLSGRLYCIMSNKEAIDQLLSLWERHKNGEEEVFKRNFSGLRDIFTHIHNIRTWNAQDRIFETNAVKYWEEQITIDGDIPVPFEIELFFRRDQTKRNNAFSIVQANVSALGGTTLKECIISDISYHCMLVEMPKNAIRQLVEDYENVSLVKIDDIMFFRPTCQSIFFNTEDSLIIPEKTVVEENVSGEPIIGILDGLPLQNHPYLKRHLIVDDPDEFEANYESKYRFHGTAMASLIIYGDLGRNDRPLLKPIYLRPILKTSADFYGGANELVPQDEILVDLIHRAVKRIFDGEGDIPPQAPSIRIINLSIGDPARQFTSTMSPLARLIDWLSYKYKVLFIISAGNHNEIENLQTTFEDFKALSIIERTKKICTSISDDIRNRKVLSPAESINSLCVGALYADACSTAENDRFIFAVQEGFPSPISSFGYGYNSQICPDLFYYGGRKLLLQNMANRRLKWGITNRKPGCEVASPSGDEFGVAYTFGTSDATAQLSHEAGKCYEVLNDIFTTETGESVPQQYAAILLKAMLTHGASWDNISNIFSETIGESCNKLSRWLGNGVPDIKRVEQCAKNRITLIGIGNLKIDDAHIYRLPIPIDFTRLIKRKLTITLAYLSPIDIARQKYRSSQIWFTIEEGKSLVPNRQNTDWQRVRKGTLQHEIFTGDNTLVWNDKDIVIKVNCKEDASRNSGITPYSIFVTFEVAEGMDIDVYTDVINKIRPREIVPLIQI